MLTNFVKTKPHFTEECNMFIAGWYCVIKTKIEIYNVLTCFTSPTAWIIYGRTLTHICSALRICCQTFIVVRTGKSQFHWKSQVIKYCK